MSLPVPEPLQDAAEALAAFLTFILSAPLLWRLLHNYHLLCELDGRVTSLAACGSLKMQLEQPHLREPLATLGAEEGSLSGVNALVSGQVPGVFEALLTFTAGIRALPRVRPQVASQV